jgi:hypothetical protein
MQVSNRLAAQVLEWNQKFINYQQMHTTCVGIDRHEDQLSSSKT